MRKYPKEWLDVVEYKLRCISDYSLMGSQRFVNFKNPDDVLKILDEAGMLKEPPQPLEINWCRIHHHADIHKNLYSSECRFIKMREVKE